MKMTIKDTKTQLVMQKSYALGKDYRALENALDIIRKYEKIAELYDYWRSGKCEYTISCMENIGKVLRDGNDDCR